MGSKGCMGFREAQGLGNQGGLWADLVSADLIFVATRM